MPTSRASPLVGVVHAAVDDVAPGCGALHGVRDLQPVGRDLFGLGEPVEVELPQVLADRGDELGVVEPDQVGAALDGGVRDLEAQRRDPVGLLEGGQVVEQQVLTGVAEEADAPAGVDARRMATGGAGEVDDLVGVVAGDRVVAEEAHAGPALEAVQTVAVESDVKGVWIAPHWHPRPARVPGVPDRSPASHGTGGPTSPIGSNTSPVEPFAFIHNGFGRIRRECEGCQRALRAALRAPPRPRRAGPSRAWRRPGGRR